MYNADLQCRLQFNITDEDIKMCSQLDEICSQLWCNINGTCMTLLRPAAHGTRCGKHKVKNYINKFLKCIMKRSVIYCFFVRGLFINDVQF